MTPRRMSSLVGAFALVATLLGRGAEGYGYEQHFCTDLKPQNGLDMNQVMGMWYGMEIISHLRDDSEITSYSTCPVIHLSDISYEHTRGVYSRDDYRYGYGMTTTESYIPPGSYGYQWGRDRYGGSRPYSDREYRHLRLYWDENGNQVEYYLKFNNTRKGFWMSSGPQNGWKGGPTLERQYSSFTGTVQVMKAVVDHLVLTFCQRLPESQLFTIILTREPQQLSYADIHSIHNMMNRKDLSTNSVRKVCNGAIIDKASYISVIVVTFTSFVMYSKSGTV